MRALLVCLLVFAWAWPALPAQAQNETAAIVSPVEGQAVAGLVAISGLAVSPQFQRYEVEFGYEPNPTDTWFPIQDPVLTPQPGGTLAQWDTVAQGIADGVYVVRLRVYRADGSFMEAFAHNILLQNGFAAGPTPAPGQQPDLPTPTPSATGVFVQLPPTSTPRPTVTPRPTDAPAARPPEPAGPSLSLPTFGQALVRGAGWTIFLFAVLGLYTVLRPRVRPYLWRLIRRMVKPR